MPLQDQYVPDIYNGNGVLDTFAFNWRILQKDDLIVELVDIPTGAAVLQVLDSDYTVANDQVDTPLGGNLVMTTPPTSTERLAISRRTDRSQLVNIVEGSPFPAATVTRVFDRLTAMIQELDYSTLLILESVFEAQEEDVVAAAVSHAVTFDTEMANTDYLILEMVTNWNTGTWFTAKATTGFTINFTNPAPASAKVVWRVRI